MNITKQLFFVLSLSLIVTACSVPVNRLGVVEKQIEDGRLVPGNALTKTQLLKSYDHLLERPINAPLSLSLEVDQPYLPLEGGKLVMQIGIASQEPKQIDKSFHFLYLRPRNSDQEVNDLLEVLSEDIANYVGTRGGVSFDWSRSPLKKKGMPKSLIKHENTADLEQMLKRYLVDISGHQNRHFIVLVADHGNLTQSQQQNVLDMASYLRSKGATLSVLALGKQPEFSFLRQLAGKGNGLFSIYVDSFELASWIKEERRYVGANEISDVKISVDLADGVEVLDSIAGPQALMRDSKFVFSLDDFREGEQRVALFRLNVPQGDDRRPLNVAKVRISVFDGNSQRYFETSSSLSVHYSGDLNKIFTQHNPRVDRSLAILQTVEVLVESERLIKAGRPYQAMAEVSKHRNHLEQLATSLKDKQLLEDARALASYEGRLYTHTGGAFQALKEWRDLNFDQHRFFSGLD
ncbi:MAG: hypothetical protein OEZ47_15560 [Gammaproteobacteria bacterium]|nr:hypothetical protein [Gammaproteobacteria bacterium]